VALLGIAARRITEHHQHLLERPEIDRRPDGDRERQTVAALGLLDPADPEAARIDAVGARR
jgi:hypothetical protein